MANKSYEEVVKDWMTTQLINMNLDYSKENHYLNSEIELALKKAPSKSGGSGGNRPDGEIMIDLGTVKIPVMIECKGSKKDLEFLDKKNLIVLKKDDDTYDYSKIKKYAVNGACYYASMILKNTTEYSDILAVGINGYEDTSKEITYEIKAYLLNIENKNTPILLGRYKDLSFLDKDNWKNLVENINDAKKDPEELHQKALQDDERLNKVLGELNQHMRDETHIEVGKRINVVASCIMAGLGVEGEVSPLDEKRLEGGKSTESDGYQILNKVKMFLKHKDLPEEKQEDIINHLQPTLLDPNLSKKDSELGITPLKSVYKLIQEKIIPAYKLSGKMDFTGKLFNVMNAWVDVPDGDANDVVLTPRYITDLMVKLAEVNMDSYVWDWALGSAGFLISAMNEMLKDARYRLSNSVEELRQKENHIRERQLLGVEKLTSIYVLAVLNMILMGDGSSNIINENSLTDFNGKYAYNNREDSEEFKADIFLLNPPYSAEGNGMIFVKKALKQMNHGKACIIIQDSAGAGKASDINKEILKDNTLLASIKMPGDIFKASVQTSIYLFEVGKPHTKNSRVKFIDFREDGYKRSNRKKAKSNLTDNGTAKERYAELIDVVINNGISDAKYLVKDETYFEDTIDPTSGNDWNLEQHQTFDIIPKEEDFMKVVGDYLSFEVDKLLHGGSVDGI